jgi:hypothetical protein
MDEVCGVVCETPPGYLEGWAYNIILTNQVGQDGEQQK